VIARPVPGRPAPGGGLAALASAGGAGTRVCPVKGLVRIGQGWGAPRDGGRRRHQGIDLLAPAGAPLVAVTSGHITRLSNTDRGRGGISLWLRNRRGTAYYYAHNQHNLVHLRQPVRVGQVIARVGTTGNARGGPPHLHFQIHPGGGPAVSPDALVRRWCR
jgi:murein DD-endopeptidase MepM/ murein hydrolase activator NlpD